MREGPSPLASLRAPSRLTAHKRARRAASVRPRVNRNNCGQWRGRVESRVLALKDDELRTQSEQEEGAGEEASGGGIRRAVRNCRRPISNRRKRLQREGRGSNELRSSSRHEKRGLLKKREGERGERRAYRRRTRRKKSMGVMAKERENQVSEEKPDVESETKKKKKKSFRPLSRLSKLYLRRETRTRPISQVLALFPTSRALSFGPGSCVHQQQLCRQLPLQLR